MQGLIVDIAFFCLVETWVVQWWCNAAIFGPHLDLSHPAKSKYEWNWNCVWASVPTAATPFPNSSQSLWIPSWLQQLLSQHRRLSCLSPAQNTRLRWLFCFWILVNIFILTTPRGVLTYDEELLTIFVLFGISSHWGRKWEKEEEGESHSWNSPEPVCKQHGGEGPQLKCVSQPSLRRHCRLTLILWHICHIHLLLCYFKGSFINSNSSIYTYIAHLYIYLLVTSLIVHIHFQSRVCGVLCRIQLFKALHTTIDALHSPFKIVKVFSITVYTLNNSKWWIPRIHHLH